MVHSTFYNNGDLAAAKVIENRGLITVGRTVKEKRTACESTVSDA
ncbi:MULTISPECIES: hypothetical protein [Okeania]|nr:MULTISPECIES: hypothetical protein [Okeania]